MPLIHADGLLRQSAFQRHFDDVISMIIDAADITRTFRY